MNNLKAIAVDAGRRAIKSAIVSGDEIVKNIFPSKFGRVDFNFLSTMTAFTFKEKEDMIVSVDDEMPMILGSTCDKLLPPEKIQYVTDDELYLQYVTTYVLTAVSRFVENNDNVILSINLTYNNMVKCNSVKENIKGKHTVKFFNTKGNVIVEKTFNVEKLASFYQGVPSLMYLAINPKTLEFDNNFKRDGIIVDIGKKTTDISLMRDFYSVKGRSYNLATGDIFKHIEDNIYENEKVRMDALDIETFVVDNEDIELKNGSIIDIKKSVQEALIYVSEQLKNKIVEDFGQYNVKWIILTGGGVHYFRDIMKEIFRSNLIILDEPVFSNTIGMCYILKRFE